MKSLQIPAGDPSDEQLKELERRWKVVLDRLKSPDSEVRLPLFVEFAGSPKSGKSTIIGIVGHFLKRMKFEVVLPAEGASLRTPPGLRDDWLAFNAWSGCYALQQILVDSNQDPPPDLVILDRGLFDVAAWMELLTKHERRATEDDQKRITLFFTLDLWRRRENAVFLFTADHQSSLSREHDNKLTRQAGSVMNEEMLAALKASYEAVAKQLNGEFPHVYHIDTSFVNGRSPSFKQIAFVVASQVVAVVEKMTGQMLLLTESVKFTGFERSPEILSATVRSIVEKPIFRERSVAEKATKMQQVVPYAVLEREGKFFCARRRAKSSRKELKLRYTLLAGGHAEQKDWDDKHPEQVFEVCLRREIEEELTGIQLHEIKPIGFIHDDRNKMGRQHLAFVHHVRAGGRTLIRRQAVDQEFTREAVEWKTPEEIKDMVSELDPWSQLVAQGLFGATIPLSGDEPSLFPPP